MTCPSCGAELADGAKFCTKCGSSTAGAEAPVREWYVYYNEENRGPYSVREVGDFLREGRITGTTSVWKEGMDGWQPAGSMPELASASEGREAPETEEERERKLKEIREKLKQEKIEEKKRLAEEKKRLKKERKKGVYAKAMGLRTDVEKWHENTLLVVFCLILPLVAAAGVGLMDLPPVALYFTLPLTPIGIVLMMKSRHFPATLKLLIVVIIVFIALFAGQNIVGASRFNLAGMERDESVLPTGFSLETFDTVELGMREEHVYYMLTDENECSDLGHTDGTISQCAWKAYDKNNNINLIHVNFQKGVVIEKCWEEKKYQKDCTKLDESARKVLRILYRW